MVFKPLFSAFRRADAALGRGLKAAFQMRWGGSQSSWWVMPHRRKDYANSVNLLSNSIIGAIVGWMARNFPEAPFAIYQRKGKDVQIVDGHPLALLIEQPNPFYPGPLMWMATIVDFALHGNAYWVKVRNAVKGVVELWWIPQQLIEPKWDTDGREYITHYEYRPGPATNAVKIDPADVVHFRWGLDPENVRKGLSPCGSLFREIFTDDEAAAFTATLLNNLGVPGVVITPSSDDVEIDKEEADEIREDFSARFTGEGRGGPMVLSGKATVQIVSFTPEQLTMRELRRIPEERASAVLGIPAVVVGLGAGLDRSIYNNFSEAREQAYENGLIPMQRLLASTIDTQLLIDFEDPGKGFRTGFDLSQVRVLQDDVKAKWDRLNGAVQAGWLEVFEARSQAGVEALPVHHYFLRGANMLEVPGDVEAAPPAPPLPPAPAALPTG